MDIFKLYRDFWNFCFENPEKIKPNDIAIFSFAIEHCNRLGWKKKFGFPTSMVMEATGIKSYSVYKKHLDNLASCGLISIIEYSKNQYSSNIIALEENYKANDKADNKALDKAFIKHSTKQSESTIQSTVQSTVQSNDSIDIQVYNDTNLQYNKDTPSAFSFYHELLKLGCEKQLVSDWLAVRKKKKLTNTETALKGFLKQVDKSGYSLNEILVKCIEKSWGGFEADWYKKEKRTEEKIRMF